MEKKFKISLLAVSVLMGAGLTSMTAFADTAKDIQALVNPLTQTDKAGAAKTYHDAKETADKYQKALAAVEAAKAKETKDTDPITAFYKAKADEMAAQLAKGKLTNEHSLIETVASAKVTDIYGATAAAATDLTNPNINFYGLVDLSKKTEDALNLTPAKLPETTILGKYIKSVNTDLARTATGGDYRSLLDTELASSTELNLNNPGNNLDNTPITSTVKKANIDSAITYYTNLYKAAVKVQLLEPVLAANKEALDIQINNIFKKASDKYTNDETKAAEKFTKPAEKAQAKLVAAAVKAYEDAEAANKNAKAKLLASAISTANGVFTTDQIDISAYTKADTNYTNAKAIYTDAETKAISATKASPAYNLGTETFLNTEKTKLKEGVAKKAYDQIGKMMDNLLALAKQADEADPTKLATLLSKIEDLNLAKTTSDLERDEAAYKKADENLKGIISGLSNVANDLKNAKEKYTKDLSKFNSAVTEYEKVTEVKALHKLTRTDLTTALESYVTAIEGVISTGGKLDQKVLGGGAALNAPLTTGPIFDYTSKLASATDASDERKKLIDTAAQVTTAKVNVLTALAKGELKGDFTNSKEAITALEKVNKDAATAAVEYTKAVDAFNAALNKATNLTAVDLTSTDPTKAPVFKNVADELAYLKAKAGLLNAAGYVDTTAVDADHVKPETKATGDFKPAVFSQLVDTSTSNKTIKTDFYSLTKKDGEGRDTGITHEPAALQAKTDADDVLKSIDNIVAGYRKNVAHSMQQLSYMVRVRATGAEAKTYTDAFAALATNDGIGAFGTTIEALKASRNDVKTKEEGTGIEKVTTAGDKDHVLYLGGLTLNEIINPIVDDKKDINRYRAIILNDKSLPKTSFSSEELKSLNLGSRGDPVFNTVLNLEASQLSADLTKPNSLTIGSADIKDSTGKVTKKGNVTDIYASAYHNMHLDKSPAGAVENSGAAVRIGGDLLDGNVGYLDAKGKLAMIAGEAGKKPVTASLLGDKTLGADSIALHNLNINNIVTLDSLKAKVKKYQDAYNKQLDELVKAKLTGTENPDAAAKDKARKEIVAEVAKAQNLAKSSAEYKSLPAAVKDAVNALDQLNTVEKVIRDGSRAIGLLVDSSTKTQVLKGGGESGLAATDGSQYNIFTAQPLTQAPVDPNLTLDSVNILVENAAGQAIGIDVTGKANNLQINGGSVIAKTYDANGGIRGGTALAFEDSSGNNKVTFKEVKNIIGDIRDEHTFAGPVTDPATNTVVLDNSHWTGDAQSSNTPTGPNFLTLELANGTVWAGRSSNSPDLIIRKNATWYVMGDSSVNSLRNDGSLTLDLVPSRSIADNYKRTYIGSGEFNPRVASVLTVEQSMDTTGALKDGKATQSITNIHAAAYSAESLDLSTGIGLANNYVYGSLQVEKQPITGGGILNLIMDSGGAEPAVTAEGRLKAADATTEHSFIRYLDKSVTVAGGTPVASDVKIPTVITEEGLYQYRSELTAVNQEGYRNVFFTRTGQLSNSAATVAGLAAAPASVAAMEGDALGKHITSLRHSESSGVWLSYYGGSNQNTLSAGPQYDLKTNGVMLGVDTSMADWMAGIAFTSGKASLSVLNSSGSVNNYGAQFWLSRHYSNGVFVNGVAQFGHYANEAKVSMIDGTPARGEYATNGYGLSAKVGYAYRHASGFYAEPYVQASGRAFSGAAYTLNNGMNVSSTDYKSFVGEIGTDLGYTVPTGAGYFKPYLHLAVLDEFANGNSVRANNIDLQNSISGAALRIGVGGELLIMKNLGGYLSYDYTKGSNIERPWQVNLGINYSW